MLEARMDSIWGDFCTQITSGIASNLAQTKTDYYSWCPYKIYVDTLYGRHAMWPQLYIPPPPRQKWCDLTFHPEVWPFTQKFDLWCCTLCNIKILVWCFMKFLPVLCYSQNKNISQTDGRTEQQLLFFEIVCGPEIAIFSSKRSPKLGLGRHLKTIVKNLLNKIKGTTPKRG